MQLSGMAGFSLAMPQLLGCGSSAASPDAGLIDAGGEPLPDAAPGTAWWLRGNYGPVYDEVDTTALQVTGSIPSALNGNYLRNGPNPKDGESAHWFLGHGMFHGLRLEGGQAAWYRNKYARTSFYNEQPFGKPGGFPDLRDTHANTALVYHAERLLALYEVALPFEIGADLSSVGVFDYGGALTTAMAAHPKIDPVSGEMFFHGYSAFAPYLTVHKVDASGGLVSSTPITTPGPSMMHELQLTESYVIFLDLPITFDFALVNSGLPYKWNDTYGARIGVMPRDGSDKDVTWFDINPCYMFHTLNAHEVSDQVIIEGVRHDRLWVDGPNMFASEPALHRWTLNMTSGAVSEEQVDDRMIEFPQVAPAVRGRAHRYGYAVEFGDSPDGVASGPGQKLVKYDIQTGSTQVLDFGPGIQPEEPLFIPKSSGGAEDAGWIFSLTYDHAHNVSRLAIVDAQAFADGPVATIRLPQRVPFGFHGVWVPDSAA